MRKQWEIYDKLLNANGNPGRERNETIAQRRMIKYSKTNGSYRTISIAGEERNVVIVSTNTTDKKTICSMPNEQFYLGDLIQWNNSFWLITEIEVDNYVYYRGKIERCNIKLRWQNKNGEIIERWGVSTDVAANSEGVIQNQVINLPKMVLGISLPLDAETSDIRRGKRFLIDVDEEHPNAYIATNRNVVTDHYDDDKSHGLCKITLSQHQRNNDTDNTELMLADYKEPETNTSEIKYSGRPEIRAGGSYKKFSIDGDYSWQVITLPEHEQYYEIIKNGNTLKIKAKDVPEIVGTQIKLVVSNEDMDTHELYVKVVSLLNG